MKLFFEQDKNYGYVNLLKDKIWCAKLDYLSDILFFFNNKSRYASTEKKISNSRDELVGFQK